MNRYLTSLLLFVLASSSSVTPLRANPPPKPTVEEARARAKLLHRTIHAPLQVVHRDYFRPGEKLPIPSQSLEDVFADLETSQNVKLRWLAVTTKAMDIDHKPQDEFESRAAVALASGTESFEAVERDTYRHASTIRLHGSCIKCHVPTQQGDRQHHAALTISLPIQQK